MEKVAQQRKGEQNAVKAKEGWTVNAAEASWD